MTYREKKTQKSKDFNFLFVVRIDSKDLFTRIDHQDFMDIFAAAIFDFHISNWLITTIGLRSLDLSHNIHSYNAFFFIIRDFSSELFFICYFSSLFTFQDLAENDMSTVQPFGFDGSDEKLRAVGVRSSISHGEPSGAVVTKLEVLVVEFVAPDRSTASAIAAGEIATLNHE